MSTQYFRMLEFGVPLQPERATLSPMGRVHDVLRWANRRAVAEEVTRRGYRVSGESLNRWVRDEKEFPAVVERIVFDLFTITGHSETAAPVWAAAMEERLGERLDRNRQLIERLIPEEALENADALIERLEERLRLRGEGPPEGSDGPAPDEAEPQVQPNGSPPGQSAGQ